MSDELRHYFQRCRLLSHMGYACTHNLEQQEHEGSRAARDGSMGILTHPVGFFDCTFDGCSRQERPSTGRQTWGTRGTRGTNQRLPVHLGGANPSFRDSFIRTVAKHGFMLACNNPVALRKIGQPFTLACIHSLYNITYIPKAADWKSLGIVSQAPATYLQSDLDMFFANFSLGLIGKSPLFARIDKATSSYDAASQDLDYQCGIYYSRKHTAKLNIVWHLSPVNVLSFNAWLSAVNGLYCMSNGSDDYAYNPPFPNLPIGDPQEHTCGTFSPPHVISNSPSSIVSAVLHPALVQRVCEAGVYGFGQSECNALQPQMAWGLSVDNIRGGDSGESQFEELGWEQRCGGSVEPGSDTWVFSSLEAEDSAITFRCRNTTRSQR
ncbi:hypothetical protein B0H14DRAFT_2612151 [Mycena olivaceomarginata]|nr:hypothetical protein B0H14DRAFT_2612151 [Mycena olivaceomarginata]